MVKVLILAGAIFMNSAHAFDGSKTYALASGDSAATRLELQDRLFGENSHEHLLKAGIARGQVVYDIGCGNGMMTSFIAKTVGDSGHVYAIDVSEAQLHLAEKRIKSEGLNNVTFLLGDITALENLPKEAADIVYGRFVLMHLQHPEKAIEKMKILLKPGGVIASQESIMSTSYCSYQTNIFKEFTNAVVNLGKHNGVDYNIGERLAKLYESAGLNAVDVYYNQQAVSAKNAQLLLLLTLNELKNKAIEANVLTKEKVNFLEEILIKLPVDDSTIFTIWQNKHIS